MKIAKDISPAFGSSVRVLKNGKANVSGIDYGPSVNLHASNRQSLILKAGGHSGWAGVGDREYVPAQFIVFKILSVRPGEKFSTFTVEPVICFTPATEYREEA